MQDKAETNGSGLWGTEALLWNSNRREQEAGRGVERA